MPTQPPQLHPRIWQTICKALIGITLMLLALSAWSETDATFSMQELIAGEPSMIEQVVKRENALRERRDNFWYFLEDHPRQRTFVIGMVLFFLLSAKAGIERFMQDDKVWVNILKRGLGLLAIVVLVVGGFLVLLPFLE